MRLGDDEVSVELPGSGFGFIVFAEAPVALERAGGVEFDGVGGEKAPGVVVGGVRRGFALFGREQEVAGPEFRISGDQSARRAGGPAVLVIEPGEHIEFFGGADALLDPLHEFGTQIRRAEPGAGVHMETAHAHFLEHADLPLELLRIEIAVPRPERRVAVKSARRCENRIEFFPVVGSVKSFHIPPLFWIDFLGTDIEYSGKCGFSMTIESKNRTKQSNDEKWNRQEERRA